MMYEIFSSDLPLEFIDIELDGIDKKNAELRDRVNQDLG